MPRRVPCSDPAALQPKTANHRATSHRSVCCLGASKRRKLLVETGSSFAQLRHARGPKAPTCLCSLSLGVSMPTDGLPAATEWLRPGRCSRPRRRLWTSCACRLAHADRRENRFNKGWTDHKEWANLIRTDSIRSMDIGKVFRRLLTMMRDLLPSVFVCCKLQSGLASG